jgi:cytochrome c
MKVGLSLRNAGLALLAAVALAGCRQDMQDQPKYIPMRESAFFGDMRSERPLPEGTVPRGYLLDDSYLNTGKFNGQDGTAFPFPITAADLRRGQERYNIYCTPCHSPLGNGRGAVPLRGFSKDIPSFSDDKLRTAAVGHYFDVMTKGFGIMQDYSYQISVEDRWRIAAYIRVLQLSQHATLADVPEAERANLDANPGEAPASEKGQK